MYEPQRLLAVSCTLLFLAGCGTEVGTFDPPDPSRFPGDADMDGITDGWEGRGAPGGEPDTDLDSFPDYLDVDSDNDGIDDAVEGRVDEGGRPADSDGDGIADFRDLDSDEDGILDSSFGGAADFDADGVENSADLDDDADGVPDVTELARMPDDPPDTDGDGTPDRWDLDSDGDAIADADEGAGADTDFDGLVDRLDLDSDADGLTDAEEAGDVDLTTPPVDTDRDSIADFRDIDSDGDGLSDADETLLGSDVLTADTDGDGFSDFVELATCEAQGALDCPRDLVDPSRGPPSRETVVVVAPRGEPMPDELSLELPLSVRRADVYVLRDGRGSFNQCFSSLRTRPPGVDPYELRAQIVGAVNGAASGWRSLVPDVQVGAGLYRTYFRYDMAPGDLNPNAPYEHYSDPGLTASLVLGVGDLSCSSEIGHALFPALWAATTGGALDGGLSPSDLTRADIGACPEGQDGWPCFRREALPVLVTATDGLPMNGPTEGGLLYLPYSDGLIGGHAPTFDETAAALRERGAHVISVATSTTSAPYLEALATAVGSVDADGAPLVGHVDEGLSSFEARAMFNGAVSDLFETLVTTLRSDVSVTWVGDARTSRDASPLVEGIDLVPEGSGTCAALAAIDTDGDGVDDGYEDASMGTTVCVRLRLRPSPALAGARTSRVLSGAVVAHGHGGFEAARQTVLFVVPPEL